MKKSFLLLCGLTSFSVFAQTTTPNFKIQVVDNQINIGYGLAVGDVDGDKRLDILLADQKTSFGIKMKALKTEHPGSDT